MSYRIGTSKKIFYLWTGTIYRSDVRIHRRVLVVANCVKRLFNDHLADLGRSQVGDELMEVIAELPHITRLHLQQTLVTDAGMPYLRGLNYGNYIREYPKNGTILFWQSLTDTIG